jgi:microcystin degradation protein MlrC
MSDLLVATRDKKVILSCDLSHETNTFSFLPTSWKNFQEQQLLLDESAIARHHRGTKSTLGATFEKADEYSWELVVPVAASANPAGRVLKEVYEDLAGRLTSTCERIHPDGILLHLHGAMVSEHVEDCEGELLLRLRNIVGKDVPIFVTLDLHGNITPRMAECASCLVAVRTYPHVDFYEIALRAADLLQRTLLGEILPVTVLAKRPQLSGLDGGKTTLADGPMNTILRRGEALEQAGQCLVVSVCAGFTAADIYDIGPSVTVTIDSKNPSTTVSQAQTLAEELMDYVWETRAFRSENFFSVDEAVGHMSAFVEKSYPTVSKPLVVADVSDNPGSGHYGDATNLLRAMVRANELPSKPLRQVVFYAIYDPRATRYAMEQIGVGNSGVLTMGGNFDVNAGGAPLTVYGRVVSITDGRFQTFGPMGFGGQWQNFGMSVLFRISHIVDSAQLYEDTKNANGHAEEGKDGEIEVILISNNGQLLDTAQITSLGVDITHKQVICVKSKQHFRACLTPVAAEIIAVDGGGLGHQILCGGEYQHVRRPIWPLDTI